jgi:hypothetical protein
MMRILIFSPHFPPANTPDMQRVRLLLPYLRGAGVEAEVLAVEADQVAAPQDPWLAEGLPADAPVHRVAALGQTWRRIPGLGNLNFRALRQLRRRGDELLRTGRFDLVVFSTTEFGLHVLGPYWKQKFGVPFVMDYQDPWVSDYYRQHPEIVPPGGRLKYAMVDWLNRRQEPKVLRECAGIFSVSAAYPKQLAERYPWLRVEDVNDRTHPTVPVPPSREGSGNIPPRSGPPLSDGDVELTDSHLLPSLVLPFPGDVRDLERVRNSAIRQRVFDAQDGLKHWVYIGVCPPSMFFSIRVLFQALSGVSRSKLDALRIHFVGTSYAAAGTAGKVIESIAAEFGLDGIVDEHPDRVAYSEASRCLLDADGLLVLGTDDPGYTASKIYPYLLARKPLLAIFHEESSVVRLIRQAGGGHVVAFASGEAVKTTSEKVLAVAGFRELQLREAPLDRTAFEPNTAAAQAGQLAAFVRTCLMSIDAGAALEPISSNMGFSS